MKNKRRRKKKRSSSPLAALPSTLTSRIRRLPLTTVTVAGAVAASGGLVVRPLPHGGPLPQHLEHDALGADDVACALDGHAGLDLDVDGPRPPVLVDHGDAAAAALPEGLDDGAGDGRRVLPRGVAQADEVLVAAYRDRGVDAEAYGRGPVGVRVGVDAAAGQRALEDGGLGSRAREVGVSVEEGGGGGVVVRHGRGVCWGGLVGCGGYVILGKLELRLGAALCCLMGCHGDMMCIRRLFVSFYDFDEEDEDVLWVEHKW